MLSRTKYDLALEEEFYANFDEVQIIKTVIFNYCSLELTAFSLIMQNLSELQVQYIIKYLSLAFDVYIMLF